MAAVERIQHGRAHIVIRKAYSIASGVSTG